MASKVYRMSIPKRYCDKNKSRNSASSQGHGARAVSGGEVHNPITRRHLAVASDRPAALLAPKQSDSDDQATKLEARDHDESYAVEEQPEDGRSDEEKPSGQPTCTRCFFLEAAWPEVRSGSTKSRSSPYADRNRRVAVRLPIGQGAVFV